MQLNMEFSLVPQVKDSGHEQHQNPLKLKYFLMSGVFF